MEARVLLVALLVATAVCCAGEVEDPAAALVAKCARVPETVRDGCYRTTSLDLVLLDPALAREMCRSITAAVWRDLCQLSIATHGAECNGINYLACRSSRERYLPGCGLIANATMAAECEAAFSFGFVSNIINNLGTILLSTLKLVVVLYVLYLIYRFVFLELTPDEYVMVEASNGTLTVTNVSETDLENAPASESATSSAENDETVELSTRKRESGSPKRKRCETLRPGEQKRRKDSPKRG